MGSEAKWTPGPWRAGPATSRGHVAGVYADEHKIAVADVPETSPGPGDPEANAHLIAAAPLLAEALEAVHAWWLSLPRDAQVENHEAAHAAITRLRAALAAATPEGQPSVEHACSRCDADTEPDLLRAYEDGAPMQCSRCGLDIDEPSAEWLRAHGYTPEGQERGA